MAVRPVASTANVVQLQFFEADGPWNAANTQQIHLTLLRTAYQRGIAAIPLLSDLLL